MVAMGFMLSAVAQQSISGKVTNASGNPIPNVSVIVKGTTVGTTTAADGTYSISVPANAKQLSFSSLTYESQDVTIGNRKNISVVLAAAGATDLATVVVTGINRVKKSEFTGAATKISEKQLEDKPVGSFEQILQGRAPGITVLTSSGQPGNPSNIIIRGQNSIEGFSDPLYIVDGIPVETSVFQGLNPNDFVSVDVLRDAASTALYGSRGSAGIIVITTKRGTSGKLKLSYSGQFGVKSKPDFAFTPMNTDQLLDAQEKYGMVVGGEGTPILPGYYYSPNNPRYATLTPAQQVAEKAILDSIRGINTNWSDEIFKTGSFSNHQISLSGGTGKTRIYSSLALYNEEGTTLRTDMKRVTWRNNIDYADDKFSLAVNTNLGYTKRNFQQSADFNTSNPFASSALAVPYHMVRDADGNYATGTGTKYVATNNLDQTFYDLNYNDQLKATLSFNAGYKLTNDVSLNLTSGVDYRETQRTNYGSKLVYTRRTSTTPTGKAGFQLEGLNRFLTASVRPSATYRKLIREKHDLEVSVYGEYIKEIEKDFAVQGFGSDPKRPNTIAVIVPSNSSNQLYPGISGYKGQSTLVSGLATARYTYNNKYTLSGSFRTDGSSKLPIANRWQQFFSVGGVWDASKEDFIRDINFINVLRVKASYGSSGNANNFPGGYYPYQASYTGGTYGGLNTTISDYPGNPDMKWEVTYVANLGLDFELANRRIYGDVNFYDKKTKDLFVQKRLDPTGGLGNDGSLSVNSGELSNKGVELAINGEVIRTKNLVWTLFANASYNKNEVLSLGGESSYETGTELVKVGMPLGSHYEVRWAGVDAATGQPLYYTKDGAITNVYSADDRVQDFGTWEAPYKGGFGTSLTFKGFDLSVLFSWQQGGNKTDNLEYFLENPSGFLASGYNQSSDLSFWTKPGDVVTTPSPLYSVNFSSKLIHDASFLRLRDVTLSYRIPQDVVGKSKLLSNARFYVQGSNLFLWTKWRGRDPEAGATNINISEYPNPRSITAGVELTF